MNRAFRWAWLLVVLVGWASSVPGAIIKWTNETDGVYSDVNNWLGGIAPVDIDVALFTNPGNYTITLTAGATNQGAQFDAAGSERMVDLGGNTWRLTNNFVVGSLTGITSALTISNGTWQTRSVQVGVSNLSQGNLTLQGITGEVSGLVGLNVGLSGTGLLTLVDSELRVSATNTLNNKHLIGRSAGGYGALEVRNGYLGISNNLSVGDGGRGLLALRGSSNVIGSSLLMAETAGSVGVLTMSEPGAYLSASLTMAAATGSRAEMYLSNGFFNVRGETKFCVDGQSLLYLNGGSLQVLGGHSYLPQQRGTGILVIASADSSMYTENLYLGRNSSPARGEIYMTNGSLNAMTITLGHTSNSVGLMYLYNGTATVRQANDVAFLMANGVNSTGLLVLADPGAVLQSYSNGCTVGVFGEGTMIISSGTVNVKGLTLARNIGASGRVLVESGSLLVPTSTLAVGNSDWGSLTLARPESYVESLNGSALLSLGASVGGDGYLYASNGAVAVRQMYVGGNGLGYAEVGAATVTVNDVLYIPNSTASSIYGDGTDTEIAYDGGAYTVLVNTATNAWIGNTGDSQTRNVVLAFRLLDTRPTNAIPRVSLAFRLSGAGASNRNFNVDLFGLRRSSSATVLTNDFAGGELLQDNIMIPANTNGTLITTSTAGSTALANWINGLYDGGAVAGDYVFLGLQFDAAPDNSAAYRVDMANSAARANQPTMTMSFEYGATGVMVLASADSFVTVTNTVRVGSGGVVAKGSLIISNGTLMARAVEVGAAGDGLLTVMNGSIVQARTNNSAFEGLRLGNNSVGGTGTVVLAHPNAQISMPSNTLVLGTQPNSRSRLLLSNGTMTVRGIITGGDIGVNSRPNSLNEITIEDASLTALLGSIECGLGGNTRSVIRMNHANAILSVTNSQIDLGSGTNSFASLVMSNGTVYTRAIKTGGNTAGSPPGQYGEWIIYNATGMLREAGGASATAIWLAGRYNCTGLMVLAHAGAYVETTNTILVGDGGVGTLIVSNGTLKTAIMTIGNQTSSVGRLVISGGQVQLGSVLNLIAAGTSSNAAATVELSGGTLRLPRLNGSAAPGAQSNLWFSGGTLEALGSFTNAFATTLTNAPGPGLVTYDTLTNSILQSGLLSGPGGLAKAGPGLLSMSVAHLFTGETLVNQGTLRLLTAGALDGSTSITVAAGATLDASTRSNGTLTVGSAQTLKGAGTVQGSVRNEGVVAPGTSAGQLSVTGGYDQVGELALELGGVTPGTGHDLLAATGTATLDGALRVSLINAFSPAAGQSFTVLTASTVSGAFATTNLPALGGGLSWEVNYPGSAVVLTVAGGATPTPYEAWAAGHGLTGTNQYDQADPDGDGYANLLEYAQGSDPTNSGSNVKIRMNLTNGAARLLIQRVNSATDIVYHVDAAYQVTNASWSTISSNVVGTWTGAATVDDNNTSAVHEVRIVDPVAAATNRFLRLRVERP